MNATMEHLMKFLKKKQETKNYGSVLVHFKDGEITGIQEKNDFNPASFIEHVDSPLKRYVVRTNKVLMEIDDQKSDQDDQKSEQDEKSVDSNVPTEAQENL